MNRFTVSFLNILNKEMGTSGIPVLNKLLTKMLLILEYCIKLIMLAKEVQV